MWLVRIVIIYGVKSQDSNYPRRKEEEKKEETSGVLEE